MGKHIQENDLKTVNGQSLLGEGDLNIEGGGSNIELNDEQFYKGEDGKYKIGYDFTVENQSVQVDGFRNLNSLKGEAGTITFGNYYEYATGVVENGSYLILKDDPVNKRANFIMGCAGAGNAFDFSNASSASINISSNEHYNNFVTSCVTGKSGVMHSMSSRNNPKTGALNIIVGRDVISPPKESSTIIDITDQKTSITTSLTLNKSDTSLPSLIIPNDSLTTTPIDGAIERGEDGRLYTSYGGGRHKLVEEQDLEGGGGIKPENVGFGLSYTDDKIQLGEESKDALGNTKHLVKLEDKDTVSIGEIVNENKRGTGGISVTKYYGTKVLIESNSSQEDNNSTLEMNGASFRLNAYRKNFNGEIRTGGVYFQNGLFYISNSDGVGNQNQIAPLEDFSAYTVGLKVDDKDYKGAIATVPYVKRTVDGMAGKGLNSANGVLNVNTKQETTDGLNLLDIYNRDGGFSLKSEHKFIAPIDGKERRAVSEIYSEEDEIRIGRTFYKDGAPDSRAIITFKDSIINISSTRDATMNGYTILNEQNAKELSQFGKSFIKLRLSNNYIAIDSTEEPKVTLLGDVLYLNANLTNPNGVTKGIPIQAFNIFNFRPARTLYFTVPIDDGTAVIKITKLGTLTIESVSNPNSKNIYINVSFLNKEIK